MGRIVAERGREGRGFPGGGVIAEDQCCDDGKDQPARFDSEVPTREPGCTMVAAGEELGGDRLALVAAVRGAVKEERRIVEERMAADRIPDAAAADYGESHEPAHESHR